MWWRPPREQVEADRVEVKNLSDGGFFYWLIKFYAFGAFALAALCVVGASAAYLHFAEDVPELPPFDRYRHDAAVTTSVRGWDGTVLADWALERRELLEFSEIPEPLVKAFLAIEDRRFFEHGGLDYRGIARALAANFRAGRVSQGGSTITQQVAKALLPAELAAQRTLFRKIPEAILARRLEAKYTKPQILALYLNEIFLGNGAYGVAAAARRFFDKSVDELDLSEMATIAGAAGAPSRFSPVANLERARARRDQVLEAMAAAGFLAAAEATSWRARPIVVRSPPDFFRERSPYFAEHVRREIARRYGDKTLWEGGLAIETTLVPWIDLSAQENVDFSLRKLDKRQGWRGPVARLSKDEAAAFRQRAAARYGAEPPVEGRLYLGLVETVAPDGTAQVSVGAKRYTLPGEDLLWAVPWSARDSTNGRRLTSAAGVLRRGDVVWVKNAHRSSLPRFSDWNYDEKNEVRYMAPFDGRRPPPGPPRLSLEQTPRVQGSIFSYDHDSGYVLAMVGGAEFDRSEFNRVVQACRQPGSSYKPIYYSLALEKGYGYGSLLNDVPRAEVDPVTGEVWTPTNLNNTVEYQVTLEYSMLWSKNVPSVQLFKLVGGREVEAWARRLGFTTTIIPDQALALGASCTKMDELTRAFSVFARNGSRAEPVYVRRVRDRHGRLLEDNTASSDAMASPGERLDRLVALAGTRRPPVIPPRTAWLMSKLLRQNVLRGHYPALRNTQIPFAGKTGTSSATMDVWFVGYNSRWMTTGWMGDDKRERQLGYKDAAFMLPVPMIARWAHEVTAGLPLQEIPWRRPKGVRESDSGGTLRTTMEEVKDDGVAPKGARAPTKG